MKRINIKSLKINVKAVNVSNAISLKRNFYIDFDGKIFFDESITLNTPIVFEYKCNKNVILIDELGNIFNDYKIKNEGEYLSIDIVFSWQKIISLNKSNMLYFDHHTDGVEIFEDDELEQIGWQATACDIQYRELTNFIESNCSGNLIYYENDIQFNGFVIVDDLIETRTKVKEFIVQKIKEKIENDLIDLDDEDVIEALEYFEIEV